MPIRTVIVGYGNIGRAVREVIANNPDLELKGIISREPERVEKEAKGVRVFDFNDLDSWLHMGVDVAMLCGGSKKDLFGDGEKVKKIILEGKNSHNLNDMLAEGGEGLLKLGQGPYLAQYFPITLDSFDDHQRISDYFDILDRVARPKGHLAVLSSGWDPGTFSEARILFDAYAKGNKPKAFYGLKPEGGKSMGHSNALLELDGIKYGIQYTHAIPNLIKKARNGEDISDKEKTVTRENFVVLKTDNLNERTRVMHEINTMEDYYVGYETTTHFISEDEFRAKHANAKQHDGIVIATGKVGKYSARQEFKCEYESNAHGTAGIMIACARGAYKLKKEGKVGAIVPADIPATYKSPRSRDELLKGFM